MPKIEKRFNTPVLSSEMNQKFMNGGEFPFFILNYYRYRDSFN